MTIEQCHKNDLKDVKEISDQQLGNNYLTESDLQHYYSSSTSHILVARNLNKVIGFSIFIIGNAEDILAELGQEHNEVLKLLGKYNRAHLHKTTAVHQKHVEQGIGSALIKHAFRKNKADIYFSLIWKRKVQTPMFHIRTKLGFKPLCEIDNYWSKNSITKSYDCPECGQPPCTCSLIIMTKRA